MTIAHVSRDRTSCQTTSYSARQGTVHRKRHPQMMCCRLTKFGTIIFGLLLVSTILAWRVTVHRHVPAAKKFCEELVPILHDIKSKTGSFPTQIDPFWWKGQTVPPLIRTQDFYLSDGTNYLFRFRDPTAFWDDVWGFDSRWTNWMTYDGY